MRMFNLFNLFRKIRTPTDINAVYVDDIKRYLQIYFVENNINWLRFQLCCITCKTLKDNVLGVEIVLGSPATFIGKGGEDITLLTTTISNWMGREVEFILIENNVWK